MNLLRFPRFLDFIVIRYLYSFLKLSKGVILLVVEVETAEVDLFLLNSDFESDGFDSDSFDSDSFDSDNFDTDDFDSDVFGSGILSSAFFNSDIFGSNNLDSDNFDTCTFDSDLDPDFDPNVVSDNVSPISVFGTLKPTKFNASAIIPSFTYKSSLLF